jgi:hypothetical protein
LPIIAAKNIVWALEMVLKPLVFDFQRTNFPVGKLQKAMKLLFRQTLILRVFWLFYNEFQFLMVEQNWKPTTLTHDLVS